MEGGSQSHRAKDFKTGLGDTESVVHRHAQKAVSIRKGKRDERMQRIRNTGPSPSSAGPSMTVDQLMASAFAMRDVFIRTGSLESLQFLQQFFRHVSEKDLNDLLDDQGLLVKSMVTLLMHTNVGHVTLAADCLVCITGEVDIIKLSSVEVLLNKTPFLEIAHTHMNQRNSPIFLDMWKCVANLACVCQDARNILIQSPIFRKANPQDPRMPVFVTEFDREDPATIQIVLLILFGFCSFDNSTICEPFIFSHWGRITKLLYSVFPAPMKEEPGGEPIEVLESLLEIIEGILYKSRPEFGAGLIYKEKPLIPFMIHLCPRLNTVNQIRAARIVAQMGFYKVPNNEFLHLMREAGCIQLMSRFSLHPVERIQREALVWFAYYAGGSSEFVSHLIYNKALDGTFEFFRRDPKQSMVVQAMFILTVACQSCYQSKTNKKESDEILKDLLITKQCLGLMCHQLDKPGQVKMVTDILALWLGLLKWNRAFVLPYLEEIGGIEKVEKLLGDNCTAIYNLASKIDDLIKDGASAAMDTLDE